MARLVILAAIAINLSGCFEFDFPDLSGWGSAGYGYTGGYGIDIPVVDDWTSKARLQIDSIEYVTPNTAKAYLTVAYDADSTIVLDRTVFGCTRYESGTFHEYVEREALTGPDTLDFTIKKTHSFVVEIDSLESYTEYYIMVTRYLTINGREDSTYCMGCATFFRTQPD